MNRQILICEQIKEGVNVMNNRDIHYTLTHTAFGRLLTAFTVRGVCAVSLGDDDESLIEALNKDFIGNRISMATAETDWSTRIGVYLSGGDSWGDIPLDLETTAFRQSVYEALQRIPEGETRSYEAVAAMIGKPRAVRAVASACANNLISIIIPCHRVVRKDGSLGGYRWGLERKRALLAWEQEER